MLHRFDFNIIASICDGASENRNFINASEAVAVEMEENENKVTKSTHEYIKYCSSLFNILNSETSFIDDNDSRLKQLININQWFYDWETEIEHHVHLTISSFVDLI